MPVAININAQDLGDHEFPAKAARALRQAGAEPGLLTLEITEHMAIATVDSVMDVLTDLRKTGITSLRGKWTQLDRSWVMPIFHPSYLLRNPTRDPGSPKALMWEDIREVRRKYDELTATR